MVFIKICEMLGIKYLKKYWPVRGSWWNKNRMNKNSISDLDSVIHEANEFTRQHLVQFSATNFIFFSTYITGKLFFSESLNFSALYATIIPYNIYEGMAFCLHHYNRTKAINQKKYLVENNIDESTSLEKVEEITIENFVIKKCMFSNSYDLNIIYDNYHYRTGMRFFDFNEGKKFILYLSEHLDVKDPKKLIIMNDCSILKKYYRNYYNSLLN